MKYHPPKQSKRLLLSLLMGFLAILLVETASAAPPPLPYLQKLSPGLRQEIAAQPANEMITVIVTMKERPNLNNLGGNNHSARVRNVINRLKKTAENSQKPLRRLLNSQKYAGQIDYVEPFWIFNGLEVKATPAVIEAIASHRRVESVALNETYQTTPPQTSLLAPEWNISMVNAPALWDLGFTGQGIVIASMDTGVDVTHPDLSAQYRGGNNSWFDPYGEHPTTPTDLTGHGTQTMGVMVGRDGNGTTLGVAPDAQWIAVKIFNDAGSASTSAIHAGFQWLLDPDGNPNSGDAPHVVNNSWSNGFPSCDLSFQTDLQALRAANILPVFAAGNSGGYPSSSVSPGNNPEAFAVGAVSSGTQLYPSSGQGPSACGELANVYPELVAPGVSIYSTDLYGTYGTSTGTSMAAPHVSGGLALLLEAFPSMTADQQAAALVNGAADLGSAGADNLYGHGLLDLLASYQWLSNPSPTPTPTNPPLPTATNTPLPTPTHTPLPVGGYQDDLSGYSTGQQPLDWVDTRANFNLRPNDSMFTMMLVDGETVFGTSSGASNIHSHYTGSDAPTENYVYNGRFRIATSSAGIGVTFLSGFLDNSAYYRLGRVSTGDPFQLTAHNAAQPVGVTDSGVVPQENSWYQFKIQVEDINGRTEIRANVWLDGAAEPSGWQINAYDDTANRLTSGTVGIWSYNLGTKYWDDFSVVPVGSAPSPTNTPPAPPTATNTAVPTSTNTPLAPPTATNTAVPTSTNTPPAPPTATNTAVPTSTNTPPAPPTATNTPLPPPTATSTPLPPTSTPPPSSGLLIYVSSSSGGNVGGVSFADEDILQFEPSTGSWSMWLDGSDVGLTGSGARDVDAFHILPDGSILLSVVGDTTLPDVGGVDDADIVRFVPTSLGNNSAGSFELYFDGSDVGLSSNGEDIDAIYLTQSGDLIISTVGNFGVAGASGKDEDLVRFTPSSLGANTAGTWSLYFDGSDVDLHNSGGEDSVGVWVDEVSETVYLTSKFEFAVTGLLGDGSDIFGCTAVSLGQSTVCTFDGLLFDGSQHGYGSESIDGLHISGP